MRILVVSPGFHGYASALGRTWASLGHDARVHVYDRARPVERYAMRTLHQDPHHRRSVRARSALTDRAVSALRDYRPEAVLIVRGDLLGDDWWEALEDSGALRVTWMYDELRRMRYSTQKLSQIGAIATYSANDVEELKAAGIRASHVPLGYDALAPIVPQQVDAVTLIGARYPSREQTLRRLAAAGIKVKAYGRDWSRHAIDQLRTSAFADPGVPVGRQLDRPVAYGTMQGSTATLNLHADQDGFTMRTFEAPGVGAVEICDRPDVSDFYDVGSEVLAYRTEEELIEQCRRVLSDPSWADRIRERGRARTVAEHTLAHRLTRLEQLWA